MVSYELTYIANFTLPRAKRRLGEVIARYARVSGIVSETAFEALPAENENKLTIAYLTMRRTSILDWIPTVTQLGPAYALRSHTDPVGGDVNTPTMAEAMFLIVRGYSVDDFEPAPDSHGYDTWCEGKAGSAVTKGARILWWSASNFKKARQWLEPEYADKSDFVRKL